MLQTNWLLEKLNAGDSACVGTWLTIPSMETTDIICAAGPDFVVIDCEHAPISLETAQRLAMVCQSNGVSPIIRVPEVAESEIVRALDTGAHGIQVPNVGSAETMHKVSRFMNYSPTGSRGFSPYVRSCGYSTHNSQNMVSEGPKNVLTIGQVEGGQGIQNISSILSDAVFDICFLGLFDLSTYIGRPGELSHPELRTLFSRLVDEIKAAGKVPGSIANNLEQQKYLIDSGIEYITHSADCHVLNDAFRTVFSHSR